MMIVSGLPVRAAEQMLMRGPTSLVEVGERWFGCPERCACASLLGPYAVVDQRGGVRRIRDLRPHQTGSPGVRGQPRSSTALSTRSRTLDHRQPGPARPADGGAPAAATRPLPGTSAHPRTGSPVRRDARQPRRHTTVGLARSPHRQPTSAPRQHRHRPARRPARGRPGDGHHRPRRGRRGGGAGERGNGWWGRGGSRRRSGPRRGRGSGAPVRCGLGCGRYCASSCSPREGRPWPHSLHPEADQEVQLTQHPGAGRQVANARPPAPTRRAHTERRRPHANGRVRMAAPVAGAEARSPARYRRAGRRRVGP